VTIRQLRDGIFNMNLLSGIDWRTVATEKPGLFEPVTVRSLDVLAALWELNLVDVNITDLLIDLVGSPDEDPELAVAVTQSALHVSLDFDYWQSAVEPASPMDLRPSTWLEAHPLGDGRWLVIPGERTAPSTLSFWRNYPTNGRPGVVSLVVDVRGRIAGVLFHRSKECQEDFERTGVCAGRVGGCECESSKSLEGSVVIDTCHCTQS
jgi:hypothetical protein